MEITGNYEVMGVVSHKGKDADSGHYVGWVRQSPGSEYWWKYDDEKVSEVTQAEVMQLKGGGDWHTAYLVFYRIKN
jgi:ubiquitin carboxyl-terminal hydrolase 14